MTETPPALMAELKTATAAAHKELDGAPFFQALSAGQLPLESYVGQLRALSVIHGVLETSLSISADPRIGSVWSDDMRKLPLLQQDLSFFEPRTVTDLREAGIAAASVDEDIRLRSLERPLTLLGFLYVLEGSTLGAQFLRPLVARSFALTSDGLCYLGSYGANVRTRWTGFQDRMNALSLTPEARSQLIEGAVDCFRRLAAVFGALYPFTPESSTRLATSINPEAGRHPVPEDQREIEAAIRAGDRCWAEFPYCEQRYGERGRRFSRSDAAWKATLYKYEPEQILEQTRWLGRVLAARGMPTVMLQATLQILVEELSRSIPARKAEYEKLLPASANLLTSRRKHLSDGQMKTLADDFQRSVGAEWTTRLPGVAELVGCAVADEIEGCEGAVASLHSWLTDRTRFPLSWVDAVEATLSQAREAAGKNAPPCSRGDAP